MMTEGLQSHDIFNLDLAALRTPMTAAAGLIKKSKPRLPRQSISVDFAFQQRIRQAAASRNQLPAVFVRQAIETAIRRAETEQRKVEPHDKADQ